MIDKEQVEHIAKLARINLTEKEKEKFSAELSSILDYIDKLNQADISSVESISQVTGLNNIVRDDIEIKKVNTEIRKEILKGAPEKKDNYFKAPKILE